MSSRIRTLQIVPARTRVFTRRISLALVITAGIAPLQISLAQQASSAPHAGSPDVIQEIVVTAQKRETSLQDTPISITAVTGDALERAHVNSMLQLQQLAPGFVMTTNAAAAQPYIRGIGTDIIAVGSDNSVAMYLDGAYLTRPAATAREFFDIKRVEVLKGPQGTLYGRNATGGAVNIITNDPTPTLEAWGSVAAGNYNLIDVKGGVNIPVSETSAVRLAFLLDERDGFTDNEFDHRTLDDSNVRAVRGKLLTKPSEELEILLSINYSEETGSRAFGQKLDPNYFAPGRDIFGGTDPADPRRVAFDQRQRQRNDFLNVDARITWDVGAATLTSTSAYTEFDSDPLTDIDSTDFNFAWAHEPEHSKAFTQEINLTSNSKEGLQWLAGLYYLHEDASNHTQVVILEDTPDQTDIRPIADSKVDAAAIYGQATLPLSEQWSITGGLRYSWEQKKHRFDVSVNDSNVLSRDDHADWNAWTPKLGVEYRPSEQLLAYASATNGFKSGGFNSAGNGEKFDPEYIWAYEAGIKSTLLSGRLQLNGAAFYYDYKDLQIRKTQPGTDGALRLVENAAAATVSGAEMEIIARPTTALALSASVAYLDAKFEDFESANPDGSDPNALLQLKGNPLPRAPEWTMIGGIEYERPMSSAYKLTLSGDVRYQSGVYFSQFEMPALYQSGYTLIDARASFSHISDRWYVAVFGRNLSDKLYASSIVISSGLAGVLRFWGEPRTYGIELGARF